MFTQHRTYETRCRPEFLDHELTYPHLSHPFYHGIREDTDGWHGLPRAGIMDMHAEDFSPCSYTGAHVETISWNSPGHSDTPSTSAIPETSMDNSCPELCGNVHGTPNCTERACLLVPPISPSLLLYEASGHQISSFNSMAIPMVADGSFGMPNLHNQQVIPTNLPTESSGLGSLNASALLTDKLLSPMEDSFLVRHAGWYQ
jgi:hypothetical protein